MDGDCDGPQYEHATKKGAMKRDGREGDKRQRMSFMEVGLKKD